MEQEKLLNWLKTEKNKDDVELEKDKKIFANQLLSMKKEDLFKKQKNTIWMRIKNLLWGN